MGRQERNSLRQGFDDAARELGSTLEPGQRVVAERLSQLGDEVQQRRHGRGRRHLGRVSAPVRGVYLHGAVGRGKTWLTESLLRQLPTAGVLRLHTFDAARRFHAQVARDVQTPGAVTAAVTRLLDGVDLLCLDEFHAHDPGDAMLLVRLVRALPARGATLLATSNYPSDGLLPDPRFQHLALPLIATLRESCDVVELSGGTDHRARGRGASRPGWSSGSWRTVPLTAPTRETADTATDLLVAGRSLSVLAVSQDRVRVSFAALCEGRTAISNLVELAERWPTVELVAVPRLRVTTAEARRRFANMVDVFCDSDVRLMVEAIAPMDDVVDVDDLDHERTRSRLRLLQPLGAV